MDIYITMARNYPLVNQKYVTTNIMEGYIIDNDVVLEANEIVRLVKDAIRYPTLPGGSEAAKFYKRHVDSTTPLYTKCNKFSKLSFIVGLMNIKCSGKMTKKSFTQMLEL